MSASPANSTPRSADPLALPAQVRRGGAELWLAIAFGGALGTLARFGLAEALPASGADWHWATLIANVVGAAALGVILVRLPNPARGPSRLRAFLATGICGGLTTFSTMQRELLSMIDGGHGALALSYAAVSIVAGLVAVLVAVRLAARGEGER
jgi:CrcB protein